MQLYLHQKSSVTVHFGTKTHLLVLLRLTVVGSDAKEFPFPSNHAWAGSAIMNSEGRIQNFMVLQAVLLERLVYLVRYNPTSLGVGKNYSM